MFHYQPLKLSTFCYVFTHACRTAGARVMFGGKALEGHAIPAVYGAMEPTAVFVPLAQLLKPEHWPLVNTELFGPFQVRT